LFSRFCTHIDQQNYFSANDTLLIAVSGGVDSMVLLYLLQQKKYKIGVAHFDHLTRKGQSTKDLEFVKEYCKSHDIPFHSKQMNKDLKYKNFQKEAHDQRYMFFKSLNYTKILTGHHKNDVTESIFLNFIRGKSLNGIGHIVKNIVRPLLIFNKDEIVKYAKKENIPYIIDASNSESDYDRNYIRNMVFPILHENFENPEIRITNLSNRVEAREKAFRLLSFKVLNPEQKEFYISILKKNITDLAELSIEVLNQYLMTLGFSLTHSKNVISSIERTGNLFESQNYTLVIGRADIRIYKNIIDPLPIEYTIDKKVDHLVFGSYKIKIEITDSIKESSSRNTLYFDLNKTGNIIQFRQWQNGDIFYPSSMKGKKQTIKKYFTNNKLDRIEKSRIPIVLNALNEVCGIVNYCVDHRFKIEEVTSNFLKISLLSE